MKAQYKLIVVEDELPARQGILNAVRRDDPEFAIVGEAEDGAEALSLIRREKPDVIITDISMPRMDGLELIGQIHDDFPDLYILIISGYNDFEYAQRALRFGVVDYLLKPVLPEQIHTILEKIRQAIEREKSFLPNRQELERKIRETLPLYRERLLLEVLKGKADPGSVTESADSLGLDFKGDFFGTVLFKTGRAEVGLEDFLVRLVEDTFSDRFSVHAVPYGDDRIALLVIVREIEERKAFIYLNRYTAKITASIERHLHLFVQCGLGRFYGGIDQVSLSLADAEKALEYGFSRESGSVISYSDLGGAMEHWTPEQPENFEGDLILNLRTGNRRGCLENIDFLKQYYSGMEDQDPRLIRMSLLELFVHVFDHMDASDKEGQRRLNQLKLSAFEEISLCGSLAELLQWAEKFLLHLMDEIEKHRLSRTLNRVDQVKEQIDLHLANPDLALDDVASRLYISPNYLRQIFKQQTGESFVEHLTRRRMEKAADLLKDPTLKIQQVAELVGYGNQRYFSMCFRKQHHLSPSEFRAVQQNEK